MPTLDNLTQQEPEWWRCIDDNHHDLACFMEDDACEYCGMPLTYYWEGYVAEVNSVVDKDHEETLGSETASDGSAEEMYDGEGEDGGSTQRPEGGYILMGVE